MSIVGLIVTLVIIALALYLARFIAGQLGAPGWVMTVINVLVALLVLLWLLDLAGWAHVGPLCHHH